MLTFCSSEAPLPEQHVLLHDSLSAGDLRLGLLEYDGRGLCRPGQVRRVSRVQFCDVLGQSLARLRRLLAAQLVDRVLRVTLDDAVAVGAGLATTVQKRANNYE